MSIVWWGRDASGITPSRGLCFWGINQVDDFSIKI